MITLVSAAGNRALIVARIYFGSAFAATQWGAVGGDDALVMPQVAES